MTIDKKKKKNAPTTTDSPVTTFKAQDIVASVWLREASGGVTYLDFTLHRTYQSKQRRTLATSERYLARNNSSILDVVQKAAKFVERHQAYPERALKEVSETESPRANMTPLPARTPSNTQPR